MYRFGLSLHFVLSMQSAVCILYLAYSLQSAVCSLHFVHLSWGRKASVLNSSRRRSPETLTLAKKKQGWTKLIRGLVGLNDLRKRYFSTQAGK